MDRSRSASCRLVCTILFDDDLSVAQLIPDPQIFFSVLTKKFLHSNYISRVYKIMLYTREPYFIIFCRNLWLLKLQWWVEPKLFRQNGRHQLWRSKFEYLQRLRFLFFKSYLKRTKVNQKRQRLAWGNKKVLLLTSKNWIFYHESTHVGKPIFMQSWVMKFA